MGLCCCLVFSTLHRKSRPHHKSNLFYLLLSRSSYLNKNLLRTSSTPRAAYRSLCRLGASYLQTSHPLPLLLPPRILRVVTGAPSCRSPSLSSPSSSPPPPPSRPSPSSSPSSPARPPSPTSTSRPPGVRSQDHRRRPPRARARRGRQQRPHPRRPSRRRLAHRASRLQSHPLRRWRLYPHRRPSLVAEQPGPVRPQGPVALPRAAPPPHRPQRRHLPLRLPRRQDLRPPRRRPRRQSGKDLHLRHRPQPPLRHRLLSRDQPQVGLHRQHRLRRPLPLHLRRPRRHRPRRKDRPRAPRLRPAPRRRPLDPRHRLHPRPAAPHVGLRRLRLQHR